MSTMPKTKREGEGKRAQGKRAMINTMRVRGKAQVKLERKLESQVGEQGLELSTKLMSSMYET